jgi:hypothetical protein
MTHNIEDGFLLLFERCSGKKLSADVKMCKRALAFRKRRISGLLDPIVHKAVRIFDAEHEFRHHSFA